MLVWWNVIKDKISKYNYIHVDRWRNLFGYFIASIAASLIGILLVVYQSNYFAIVLLLTGPCVFFRALYRIRKAINTDKARGRYCPECNDLLRVREIEGIDEDGVLVNGQDSYCFKCQKSTNIELHQNNEDEAKKMAAKRVSPFKLSVMMFVLISFICILVLIPLLTIDAFFELRKRLLDKRAPIINGIVIDREPIIYKGIVPGANFSIKVANENAIIHAKTQRYLIDKVPDKVSIHYTGDPGREVYLIDYEENPLWEFLLCLLGTTIFLVLIVRKQKDKQHG